MHGKFQRMGNLGPLLYKMSAHGISETSFQIRQILSSTPTVWDLPTLPVPFTVVEPLRELGLNTKCTGIHLSEWDLCLQRGYLLPNQLVRTRFLIRKTAYGGEKKNCEGGDRHLCVDFHSSIIRKNEALFLTVHIGSIVI